MIDCILFCIAVFFAGITIASFVIFNLTDISKWGVLSGISLGIFFILFIATAVISSAHEKWYKFENDKEWVMINYDERLLDRIYKDSVLEYEKESFKIRMKVESYKIVEKD